MDDGLSANPIASTKEDAAREAYLNRLALFGTPFKSKVGKESIWKGVGMRRCMTKSFEPDATGPSPCESGHPHTLLCIAKRKA